MGCSGRRISSDRMAKVSSVLTVIGVVVAGLLAVVCIGLFAEENSEVSYRVTFSVQDMEVHDDRGYVYDVCKNTHSNTTYYNPDTKSFDLLSPSGYAYLYTSIKIHDVTNPTENVKRSVQTAGLDSEPMDTMNVAFNIKTSAGYIEPTIFLLVNGMDPQSSGSVVDIFNRDPGQSGVQIKLDLEEGTTDYLFIGNSQSQTYGLLKMSVNIERV